MRTILERCLPPTLYGRLVLVLVLGLALAQLASAALQLYDRVWFYNEARLQASVREIVTLVERTSALSREQRREIARNFNHQPKDSMYSTTVLFTVDAQALSGNNPMFDPDTEKARNFQAMLQKRLGPAQTVQVFESQTVLARPLPMPAGALDHRGANPSGKGAPSLPIVFGDRPDASGQQIPGPTALPNGQPPTALPHGQAPTAPPPGSFGPPPDHPPMLGQPQARPPGQFPSDTNYPGQPQPDQPGAHPPMPQDPSAPGYHSVATQNGRPQHLPSYGYATPLMLVQVAYPDGSRATFDVVLPADNPPDPTRLLLQLAVLLVSVLLMAWLAARWLTRPLAKLAAAASRFGENLHSPPVAETGPREVVTAAAALNTMQQQLLDYLNDRTRIFAAMSHDLKTPITRLRLRAEMLDDETLREKTLRDIDEMQAMVSTTLEFMRGSDAREPTVPLDLNALLESIADDCREFGHTVRLHGQTAPYPGKPMAMKRCLANLIENGLKYGNGQIDIFVEDAERHLTLRIRDQGPGIPEDQLEKVFEPFYRLEQSRNRDTGGTGLGLPIARNIALAHGGRLTLRNIAGSGLEAELVLPR